MKKFLLILTVFLLTLGFIGCNKSGSELDIDLDEFIETPKNLIITDKVLSWDTVENADGYIIYLNGEEEGKVNINSFDFSDLTGDSLIFQVKTAAPRGMQDSGLSASIAYVANSYQEISDITQMLSQTSWDIPDGFGEELVRKGMTYSVLEGYMDAFEVYTLSLETSNNMMDQYNSLNTLLSNFENIEAIISAFVVTLLPVSIQNQIDDLQEQLDDTSPYYYVNREEIELNIAALQALLVEIENNPDAIVISIRTTMDYLMSIEELISTDLITYIQNLTDEIDGTEPNFNISEIVLIKEEIVDVLRETMPSQEDMILMYQLYDVVASVSESSINLEISVNDFSGKMAARTLYSFAAVINFLDSLDQAYFEVIFSLVEDDEAYELFIAEKFIKTIEYYDAFRDDNEELLKSISDVFTDEEKEILFDDYISSIENNEMIEEEYGDQLDSLLTAFSDLNFELLLYLETTNQEAFDAALDMFVERDGELLNKLIELQGFIYYTYYNEYSNSVIGEIYDSFGEFSHYKTLATYDFVEELVYVLDAALNSINDEDYGTFIEVLFAIIPIDLLTPALEIDNNSATAIVDAFNSMLDASKENQLDFVQNLFEYIIDENVIDGLYQVEEDVYAYWTTEYTGLDYNYIAENDTYVKYAFMIEMASYYVDFMNNSNRGLIDDIIDEVVLFMKNDTFLDYTLLTDTEIDYFSTNISDLLDYIEATLNQIADFDASNLSSANEADIEAFVAEIAIRLFTIMNDPLATKN